MRSSFIEAQKSWIVYRWRSILLSVIKLIQSAAVILSSLIGLSAACEAGELLSPPMFETQRLFKDQRYPNVVVTTKGTVLAVWGNDGVVVRRSEDGGKSWGPTIPVAEAGYHGGGTTVDTNSGDILIFVEERQPPAPLTVYRSSDDGKLWQIQKTEIANDENGNTPSMHMNEHGTTLRHGRHRGRMIRPSRYYGPNGGEAEWPIQYTNAIYSDDGGRSWQTSKPFPENGTGEAALVELADGRIYYNSRVHWSKRPRNKRRREGWSVDGGVTWKDWRIIDALPDGDQGRTYGCMGGLTRIPSKDRDILIFSNLDTDASHRERVTVWASFDGGKTWPIKRLVDAGRSGYSSLTTGRPGSPSSGWIYLLYEHDPFKGAHIARFNLAWVMGGKPTGDGVIPKLQDADEK
ncbi:MAG: sialidase family protein [Verrucomicrobiales bacterium]